MITEADRDTKLLFESLYLLPSLTNDCSLVCVLNVDRDACDIVHDNGSLYSKFFLKVLLEVV